MLQFDDDWDLHKRFMKNGNYVAWLESFAIDDDCRAIDSDDSSYSMLLRKLWEITYHPEGGGIGNDMDRAADGMELRRKYDTMFYRRPGFEHAIEQDEFIRALFGPCRMLEVLVTMAMQMYDIMLDTGVYNSVARWFWEMMGNIGLIGYDDESYDGDAVEKVVNDLLSRNGPDGCRGGLFLSYEWKTKEIWYQMHEYLSVYFE